MASGEASATFANATFSDQAIEQAKVFALAANETAKTLGGVALHKIQEFPARQEWTGIGVGWLRSLLGRREWMLDCMDVKIRL